MPAIVHIWRDETDIQPEKIVDLILPHKAVPVQARDAHDGAAQRRGQTQVVEEIIFVKGVCQFEALRGTGTEDLYQAAAFFFESRHTLQEVFRANGDKLLFHRYSPLGGG